VLYTVTIGFQTVEIFLVLSEVEDVLLQLEVSLIVNSILEYYHLGPSKCSGTGRQQFTTYLPPPNNECFLKRLLVRHKVGLMLQKSNVISFVIVHNEPCRTGGLIKHFMQYSNENRNGKSSSSL
jgi:hypothetical protein